MHWAERRRRSHTLGSTRRGSATGCLRSYMNSIQASTEWKLLLAAMSGGPTSTQTLKGRWRLATTVQECATLRRRHYFSHGGDYMTLAESAYWLCRVSREIFLHGRRCPLQMARDLRHDKDNNREHHQHSASPFLFVWLSRRNSEWQWSSIHLGPVCWLPETEWSQTHQVCSIPSCSQRSCWKNGPSSEERSQACFMT